MIAYEHIKRAAAMAYNHNIRASAGYFGVVVPHSPGYVKKLSPGDWAYSEYIQRVAGGDFGTAHVPEVKRLHNDNDATIVIMERLESVRTSYDVRDFNNLRLACNALVDAWDEIDDIDDEAEVQEFADAMPEIEDAGLDAAMRAPELIEVCYWIGKLAEELGCHFDLHCNNVMVRGSDGKVIVTDPLCDLDEGLPIEDCASGYGSGWYSSTYDSECSDAHSEDCECNMCRDIRACQLDLGTADC